MMREPDVRDIEGVTYEVRPLATSAGLKMMTRLTKVLGAGTAAIIADPQSLGRAVPELLSAVDEDALAKICAEFGAASCVHLSPSQKPPLTGDFFEQHFAGRYHALALWLMFCLEVNFGPLVGWLRIAMPDEAPKAAAPTEPSK